MIATWALVAAALANDYDPLLVGPGYFAFTPLAISHGHTAYVPAYDVAGTCFGLGMGMNFSLMGLIREKHYGVHIQDFVGADFDFGVRTGAMYERPTWGRVSIDLGLTVIYESDDVDAWIRFGPKAGMDGARTRGVQESSEGGWRLSVGAQAGGATFEIGPGIGMGDGGPAGNDHGRDFSVIVRSFVGVSSSIAIGVEAEHMGLSNRVPRTTPGATRLSTNRLQFMVRIF